MVTKNDSTARRQKQEKNGRKGWRVPAGQARATGGHAVIPITAETPHGLCGERLSTFGGLTVLVKYLSPIEFKEVFDSAYIGPRQS